MHNFECGLFGLVNVQRIIGTNEQMVGHKGEGMRSSINGDVVAEFSSNIAVMD